MRTWLLIVGLVEREGEGDDRRHLEDDQGHVLERLPHQLEECFGGLRGNCVRPEHVSPVLQVAPVSRQAGTRARVEFASNLEN